MLPRREPRPGDLSIRQMPYAPLLQLPLRQHPGPAARVLVREGQEVSRGQLLAEAGDEDGVPLHASATGRVVRLVEAPGPTGDAETFIELAPFPGDTQEPRGGPGCDPEAASAEEILAAIRAAGVIGLGGEGVPAHLRLRRARAQGVRTLVLNGIEVENVFGRVPAILRLESDELLAGARALRKALGAERVILAVEFPDREAARAVLGVAPSSLSLELRVLEPHYPQGAEALLLRVLAAGSGRRPGAKTDACCFNIATVAEIGRLLASGATMTDQVVSLAGGILARAGNYRIPFGTPVDYALAQAGLQVEPGRVLDGGPMRGNALATLGQPVRKGMVGLFASSREELRAPEPVLACIRCGDCVSACPVQLHPAQLGLLARKSDFKAMHEEYYLDSCFECGCCSYVCPSRIPLVQLFRAAKAQWQRRRHAVVGGAET